MVGLSVGSGRTAPRDFPREKLKGNPEEQPYQPEENAAFPNAFTRIYILFQTGFFYFPNKLQDLKQKLFVLKITVTTSEEKYKILRQLYKKMELFVNLPFCLRTPVNSH